MLVYICEIEPEVDQGVIVTTFLSSPVQELPGEQMTIASPSSMACSHVWSASRSTSWSMNCQSVEATKRDESLPRDEGFLRTESELTQHTFQYAPETYWNQLLQNGVRHS